MLFADCHFESIAEIPQCDRGSSEWPADTGLENLENPADTAIAIGTFHLSRKTVSTDELASLMRVTRKSVQIWISEGMPVAKLGKQGGDAHRLDLAACTEWWFSRNYERLNLMRSQSALLRLQADKIAMHNAAKRANLVSPRALRREYAPLMRFIRDSARAIPERLAPTLATLTTTAEVHAAIQREIFQLVDSAAAWEPRRTRR